MKIFLFGGGFFLACIWSLFFPAAGVFAYMANYIVAPDKQWWGEPLVQMGVRFSWLLVLCIAGGLALQWSRLKEHFTGAFLHSQEILVGLFVAWVLLSRLWGVPIDNTLRDLSGTSVTPEEKMPKVAVFVLMMTHILTRYRETRLVPWILVLVGGLYLGVDAYTASASRYSRGRLDYLGGTDFAESSTVGAHLAFVIAIAGVLFLKSRNLVPKALCFVAAGFTINAIILTQTRAAMLALLVGGVAAFLLAPRRKRLLIFLFLVLGAVGAFSLTNQYFWARAETINTSQEERDEAATSRLDVWKAGLQMFRDHPMGVGAGSFYTVIGEYDFRHSGRDCHNTYIRCAAELGVPGIVLFVALIVNAFRSLRRATRLAADTPLAGDIGWDSYGFQLGLIVYCTAGWFMGLTYVEELWWFLCLPVCLERSALYARQSLTQSDDSPVVKRPVLYVRPNLIGAGIRRTGAD